MMKNFNSAENTGYLSTSRSIIKIRVNLNPILNSAPGQFVKIAPPSNSNDTASINGSSDSDLDIEYKPMPIRKRHAIAEFAVPKKISNNRMDEIIGRDFLSEMVDLVSISSEN